MFSRACLFLALRERAAAMSARAQSERHAQKGHHIGKRHLLWNLSLECCE